jgi:RNA polymerase sigma factor (sigma-70 family)
VRPDPFENYVRDVAPDLLAFFARRVFPVEDAADCVAETMVVLWRRHDDLPVGSDARRAWAFGVARGVFANYRRSGSRRLALADQLRSALPRAASDQSESSPELKSALANLKEADRELVLLVAWEGLTLETAAQLLGIKAPAARARYSRARSKLREALA